MKAEIITIGDEILIGQIVDTNSAWLASTLNNVGVSIYQITSVSDTEAHIYTALSDAQQRADLVIVTGGLGPTIDDVTKNVLCRFFDTTLVENAHVLDDITHFLSRRGGELNVQNRRQAEVPQNCTVLRNRIGTAPGMLFTKGDTVFISLPGVPFEMKHIFQEKVIPYMKKHLHQEAHIIHKTISTTGIAEAKLAEMLQHWERELPDKLKVAYLPSPGNNRIRLSAAGTNRHELDLQIQQALEGLQSIIPSAIVGTNDEAIEVVVSRMLAEYGQTLATAESCTGGNIAHQLTMIAGSSQYFLGGIVAYSNEAKVNLLTVKQSTVDNYGAVSEQVVSEMAQNARRAFGTTYAIAVSGIAGPTGGSAEKPVGTTWIAVSTPQGVIAEQFSFGEDRHRNITRATIAALDMLRRNMDRSYKF